MLVKGSGRPVENVERAIVVQLGDIGDVVLSFPVVRAVKESHPSCRIMFIVREKAGELARCCRWADRVATVGEAKKPLLKRAADQSSLIGKVRGFGADLCMDLRTGTRGAFITAASGARRRAGFFTPEGRLWRNRVFTDLWFPAPDLGIHMTEYLLGLARVIGLDTRFPAPEIEVADRERQKANELLESVGVDGGPVVAIQPFSLWSYKEWGDGKYAELAARIVDAYNFGVIITGSAAEARRGGMIAEASGRKGVRSIAGMTDIGVLPALLERCVLFIGGDSAGIHIAAAVGTPTVCIFGPASSTFWAPRGEKHRVVDKGLSCIPCNLKGCDGGGISRCLETLSVDDVFSVVEQQLGTWVKGV